MEHLRFHLDQAPEQAIPSKSNQTSATLYEFRYSRQEKQFGGHYDGVREGRR